MEQVMQNAQKVTPPVFLRRGLDAFRVGEGGKKKYLLRTPWDDNIYEFEPWQFFILEVLPECDEYAKLASVFEDRYGHPITKDEVEELFSLLADKSLFGLPAISHPLVASYEKTRSTPIFVESFESLQEAASNRKAGENNINAGAASSEQQAQPTTAIHTESNHLKGSGSAAKASQGPLPSGGHRRLELINTLGIPEGETQGFLGKAMFKAQQSASSDKRRATQHVANRPAAASPPAAGGSSYHRVEVTSPEPHADSPTAESTKSNRNAESKRAVETIEKPIPASVGGAPPELHADSSAAESTKSNKNTESNRTVKTIEKPLPAGVCDAIGLDDTIRKQGWKLFNPSWLIKLLHPVLSPFRHTIYLLPLILIAALFICARHAFVIEEDFKRLLFNTSFFEHALLSMVTVNLSVTLVTALVAYTYRATVSAFCIVFLVGFFPRFMVRIGNAEQLSRRERVWLHAAPLLLRLALFSVGILVWFNTRAMHEFLAYLGLAIAFASIISFFITANPLIKSNGYHLVAAFLNEPHLREKSYKLLLNKSRSNVYKQADNNVLVGYALASILFMLGISVAMLIILDRFLKIYLGGPSVLLIIFIALVLLWSMIKKFKETNAAYELSVQFERWRERTLPQIENETVQKKRPKTSIIYLRRCVLLLFLAALFLPYNYEPGGNFTVLPAQQQNISPEIAGIIEKINFDGGEMLKKGTVIGQLSYSDYAAQVKIFTAKIDQQQAVIDELKSKPKPEEVRLARSALETEKTRAEFSKGKADRLKDLYEQGVVSFEDYDDARRTYEVDIDQVKQEIANLELVESGATPDEIAAEEAKLQSYQEELNYYQEKIEKSVFYMPFDGKLITMHLKQKIGSYLDKGEPLAVAENTDQVIVEIEIRESDIHYVKENSKMRIRPHVYPNEDFYGVVTAIDANVTDEKLGKVVKVVTLIENKDNRLKSGMTGYAKINSETMPVWKVFTLAIIRFTKVEIWSWLP